MKNYIISEIRKSIREKGLVLFCGSGISKNSGLPLAGELTQCILEKLLIDKGDKKKTIVDSNLSLPFEAFMETILENTDISTILEIFQNGEPNTNHILLAKLAKKGYLKTIFTTNFDLLLEKALQKEGLKENVDFKRYYNEKQFSRIDFNKSDDKIAIFKIHGSIDDRDSIRATMKAVASKTLSDKRMHVIRYLFSTGKQKKVLVLGYSCSDEFDIIPQIQSIGENQKEIIFVEHPKKEEEIEIEDEIGIEDIKTKDIKNPFKTFPGKRIYCNTDDFIRELWNSLKETIGEYEFVKSEVNWKMYLDGWAKGLKEYIKYFIASSIFYKISNFRKAIEYCEKASEIAKETGDKEGEAASYVNIGIAFRSFDPKKAIECHERALEIFREVRDKVRESTCYANLGIAYDSLGKNKKAIEYHGKALEIAKETGDTEGEAASYVNLGIAFRNSKKAIEHYKGALKIFKEIGDKARESTCYVNLGIAYNYESLREPKRAIEYYEKALKIKKEIGDREGESICYANLGIAYDSLRKPKRAIEYYEKALKIKKEIGDKEGESIGYMNLGIVYMSSEDPKKAIEYFLKAERILEKTGQIHFLKIVYNNLALAYEKIGDNEKAEYYKARRLD
jgi:tetratricopeptide (TPR) repeat protein